MFTGILFVFAALGTEAWALHIPGKHPTTELHSQSLTTYFTQMKQNPKGMREQSPCWSETHSSREELLEAGMRSQAGNHPNSIQK